MVSNVPHLVRWFQPFLRGTHGSASSPPPPAASDASREEAEAIEYAAQAFSSGHQRFISISLSRKEEGTQRDSRQRVEEHQTKGMSDGVIPETHRGANKDLATYSLLAGCSSWTLCSSDALAPCSAFAYRRVSRNLPVPISGRAELLF